MQKLIISLAVLFLVSCSNPSNQTTPDTALQVGFIDSLTVDGCSETYTFDTVPLKNNKYVFSSDLTDNANIKINGTEIFFKRDTATQVGEKVVWKSDLYTIEVNVHMVKQTCDECSYNKGTITIIYNNKKTVINVHGESGC